MTTSSTPVLLPKVVPPEPVHSPWRRNLRASDALVWLKKGWKDLMFQPHTSLIYGFLVYLVSIALVGALYYFGADYILFPALAGFMVVGPVLAVGLYEKSRRIGRGERVSLASMLVVKPRSKHQLLFTGVLLCILMLLWMRAAVIIYALFFGFRPFPGLHQLAPMLFGTPTGWAMLFVGSGVGALFASFAFAISAISIPMMTAGRVDALTAMGSSFAFVANNLPVMMAWGAIVLSLFVLSLGTMLLGLIFIFPLLGHGTWHAYLAMVPDLDNEPVPDPIAASSDIYRQVNI
mgnify:CR=1 FL=1